MTYLLSHLDIQQNATKLSGTETKKVLKEYWCIFAIDATSNSLTIAGQMGTDPEL